MTVPPVGILYVNFVPTGYFVNSSLESLIELFVVSTTDESDESNNVAFGLEIVIVVPVIPVTLISSSCVYVVPTTNFDDNLI